MSSYTIGQLARLSGFGAETIRYYEREQLVHEPPRRASGYREYPEDTLARLRFIRHAKELGFSLKDIKDLLELRVAPGPLARVFANAPRRRSPTCAPSKRNSGKSSKPW